MALSASPTRLALWMSLGWGLISAGFVGAAALAGASGVLFWLGAVFVTGAPIALIWGLTLLASQSAASSLAITAQAEAAERLAADVAALDYVLADQATAIEAKLNASLAVLEERVERCAGDMASAVAILAEDAAEALTLRNAEIEAGLAQISELAGQGLSARLDRLDAAVEAQGQAVQDRLDTRLADLDDRQEGVARRFFEAASETAQSRLETLVDEIAAAQAAQSATLETALGEIATKADAALARRAALIEQQGEALERDVAKPLAELRQGLSTLAATLTANPPASEAQLAARLAEAAEAALTPERERLAALTERIDGLAARVDALVVRPDPLVRGIAGAPDLPATEIAPLPAFLFDDFPDEDGPGPLNWPAVLDVLDLDEDEGAAAEAGDRLVAMLGAMARRLSDQLADEGITLAELDASPAARKTWIAFTQGKRGGAVARDMAVIRDDGALALTRARLKSDGDFRGLALGYQARFERLLARALAEEGRKAAFEDLADTQGGRAFILLAQAMQSFEKRSDGADL